MARFFDDAPAAVSLFGILIHIRRYSRGFLHYKIEITAVLRHGDYMAYHQCVLLPQGGCFRCSAVSARFARRFASVISPHFAFGAAVAAAAGFRFPAFIRRRAYHHITGYAMSAIADYFSIFPFLSPFRFHVIYFRSPSYGHAQGRRHILPPQGESLPDRMAFPRMTMTISLPSLSLFTLVSRFARSIACRGGAGEQAAAYDGLFFQGNIFSPLPSE